MEEWRTQAAKVDLLLLLYHGLSHNYAVLHIKNKINIPKNQTTKQSKTPKAKTITPKQTPKTEQTKIEKGKEYYKKQSKVTKCYVANQNPFGIIQHLFNGLKTAPASSQICTGTPAGQISASLSPETPAALGIVVLFPRGLCCFGFFLKKIDFVFLTAETQGFSVLSAVPCASSVL